jgi:hypothetical protein
MEMQAESAVGALDSGGRVFRLQRGLMSRCLPPSAKDDSLRLGYGLV